jgi:ABC-type transport system substrate-binding protein
MTRRRPLLQAALAAPWAAGSAALHAAPASSGAARAQTLRMAFPAAEAGFDPPRVGDAQSYVVLGAIFESPLTWDYLARPARAVPCTAAALPEAFDNFTRFVVTLRPGIFFADDPAFGGQARELVAQDYVYSVKRFYDPAIITERLYLFENAKLLGLSELRRQAQATKTPFPYDTPVEGIRALDRYRFEVRLGAPAPRFTELMVAPSTFGAVAREVIERYAADPMAHPVGTGPFRLAEWRRSSRIVLERNPRYRGTVFTSEAPEGDVQAARIAEQLRGKRLPLLERVEIAVIVEDQPRWLAFEGGELDAVQVPLPFAPRVVPGGRLAPYLVRQNVQLQRSLMAGVSFTFFNCEHPMVGGLAPAQVALRRAIAMGCDNPTLLSQGFLGQGIPAQSMLAPFNSGYDDALVSEVSAYAPARAKALLDLYGFVDRNGDGFRERPDGSALAIELAGVADQRSRQVAEIWQRRMGALGLRFSFAFMPFAELIRRTLAGSLMMSAMNWNNGPDGDFYLSLAYGPNAGQNNDSRFQLAAYDALYERQRVMPDGPERLALMRELQAMMLAYMPYLPHVHQQLSDVSRPWLKGWWRHPLQEQRLLHAFIED